MWYDDIDDMIGGLVHGDVLISLNKLNNERRMHTMNEYEKYLFELLVYHKGNFVTAEMLADLYGADLQKDLQEIFDFYGVEY